MLSRLFAWIHQIFHQPSKIFLWGVGLTLIMLVYDGSIWRLWSLQRGQEDMQSRMVDLELKAKNMEFKIHHAKKLTYIERQATDQFDYVREGDLIFVFTE